MKTIDLNVDVGEGFGFDADLLGIATSANVCCGAHAGSLVETLYTIKACQKRGVRIGAHPGYPDRDTMGRETLDLSDPERAMATRISLREQLRAFSELCRPKYIKPHGALYNQSLDEGPAADLLLELVAESRCSLMGLPGSQHEAIASAAGVRLIREGFADRAYDGRGRLTPRSQPGAVLVDPDDVVEQALRLAQQVDSICIHGDTTGCVELARRVRAALEEAGFEVGS